MISRSPDNPTARRRDLPNGRHEPLLDHCCAVWNRLHSLGERAPRLIGVTSVRRGEGATTVAGHLALAAIDSAGRQNVLLVDANLRSPAAHRLLPGRRGPGLAEVVAGTSDWNEAVQTLEGCGVSLLAAGAAGGDFTTASDLVRCQELLTELAAKFDVVLVDLPPVGDVGLTLPLAGNMDGMILVVEAERTTWEDAQRSAQLLSDAQACMLGVVLNKRRDLLPRWLRR